MNGTLRTALLFFVRSRVQRWFFALALLSFTARLLILRMPCACKRETSLIYLLSIMPAFSFAAASIMVSAGVFRTISSLRTVYLIPRARAKLIVGLLLAQILVAVVVTLIVVALETSSVAPPAWGSPRGSFELCFGTTTLAIIAAQLIAGPSRIMAVVSGSLSLLLLARADFYSQPEIAGVPTADLLMIAALVAWAGFSAWYLTTGPIAPASVVWATGRALPLRRSANPTAITRDKALDTYLLGQPSFWLICRKPLFHWCIFLATWTVLVISPSLFIKLDHYPPPNFTGLITTFLIVVPMLSNTVAGNIARNSHSLWLRSSESRGALFLRAERLAWRAFVFFGVPLLVAAAAAWSVLPHPMFAAAYFVAVLLPVVPCGIYCGLLNFNRPSDLWFFALFLILGMGSFFAATWDGASSAEAICGVRIGYWAIPPAIAVLALAIRWFAQRRWRTIDWLRFRAPRRVGATRGPLSNN